MAVSVSGPSSGLVERMKASLGPFYAAGLVCLLIVASIAVISFSSPSSSKQTARSDQSVATQLVTLTAHNLGSFEHIPSKHQVKARCPSKGELNEFNININRSLLISRIGDYITNIENEFKCSEQKILFWSTLIRFQPGVPIELINTAIREIQPPKYYYLQAYDSATANLEFSNGRKLHDCLMTHLDRCTNAKSSEENSPNVARGFSNIDAFSADVIAPPESTDEITNHIPNDFTFTIPPRTTSTEPESTDEATDHIPNEFTFTIRPRTTSAEPESTDEATDHIPNDFTFTVRPRTTAAEPESTDEATDHIPNDFTFTIRPRTTTTEPESTDEATDHIPNDFTFTFGTRHTSTSSEEETLTGGVNVGAVDGELNFEIFNSAVSNNNGRLIQNVFENDELQEVELKVAELEEVNDKFIM